MPYRIAEDGLEEGFFEGKSQLEAIVYRTDGQVEDLGVICRKIVSNAFLAVVTGVMRAVPGDVTRLQAYKYHEWGTSTTAESATHTAVITAAAPTDDPATRVTGSQAGSGATYVSVATITAAGSVTIAEHCIHPETSADTHGLDRSVFTGIALNLGDSIQFTYTLTLVGS